MSDNPMIQRVSEMTAPCTVPWNQPQGCLKSSDTSRHFLRAPFSLREGVIR